MSKNFTKELEELTKAEIISEDTAEKIRNYYQTKQNNSSTVLVAFAIIGAILVGLGFILIIAHNWDNLSRPTKVVFAFMPLILAQLLCGFSLLKKQEQSVWVESTSILLFFAVGASISLVSQIYNIQGNLSAFLFIWGLLCLPIIYLMRSYAASLLYICVITYYAVESNYTWSFLMNKENIHYWWMFLLVVPNYVINFKKLPHSNAIRIHNWIIPISLTIALSTLSHRGEDFLYMAYLSLFGIFYALGNASVYSQSKRRGNGFLVLGSLGTISLLLTLSFNWFWERSLNIKNIYDLEFIAAMLTSLAALALTGWQLNKKNNNGIILIKFAFAIYIALYTISNFYPYTSQILTNVLILSIGVNLILNGTKEDHLGLINYGMLVITSLIICRFFDSNISFIMRGLLFIAVGAGFFVANYLILKRRKQK
ncbi:MAG TPA: DUF2157 domain-containing protein [Bacteroidia bacterium]|nr:DUF2157 domain-containing protein [Bacteroidia bacterium]